MKALMKLMAGLFIVALDGRVQMNIILINIITDAAGYALILMSLTELIPWSPCFKRGRRHAIGAFISSLGIRAVNYFELPQSFYALVYGMSAIFYIYMTYYIMEGLLVKNKTEKITEPNSNLRGAWTALAIAQFLYSFCYLAEIGSLLEGVGLGGLEAPVKALFGAAAFAANTFFVIMINQIRMLLFPKQEEK